MVDNQKFRTAVRGFNRQDVVAYIEYMNNKHNAQIAQLTNQLQQEQARPTDEQLKLQLEAANARIAELEAELEAKVEAAESVAEGELEAYRRAERTERQARERARQIYDRANAALADATVKAEELSREICDVADQAQLQLKGYQMSVDQAKQAFKNAVDALYCVQPDEE